MKVYAAYWDHNTRILSSSGGLFTALAENILNNKGIVYGVTMAKECYTAEFARITEKGELNRLRGSKYLQAIIGDTYHNIKNDLENGNKVLFSGTGCQINGLISFLGKNYSNLVCVDFVCHGVPSAKLWKAYMSYREKQIGKIETVNFRSKEYGWHNFGVKENLIYTSKEEHSYMQIFLRDFALRPSCYECVAKKSKSSDITLGDFWGIDAIAPEMNDEKGTSLVILRNEKGEELFDEIKTLLKYKEVLYEEGVRYNPSEYKSVKKPKERDVFYKDLNQNSFEDIIKRYGAPRRQKMKDKIICKISSYKKRLVKCLKK